jgi:hypothetical protein
MHNWPMIARLAKRLKTFWHIVSVFFILEDVCSILGPDGEGRPPDYTLQQLDQPHQYTPNYLPHYTHRAGE